MRDDSVSVEFESHIFLSRVLRVVRGKILKSIGNVHIVLLYIIKFLYDKFGLILLRNYLVNYLTRAYSHFVRYLKGAQLLKLLTKKYGFRIQPRHCRPSLAGI
jgi:hypothetical protein